MLLCKYAFDCINNSIVIYLKKINVYLTETKKKNSRNLFLIIANENLLYLKI